ncbi:MAG: hypothetical protein AB9869_10440 [Verrucomicrobiia bacterium]
MVRHITLASLRSEILACLKLDEHLLAEAARSGLGEAEQLVREAKTENAAFRRALDAGARFEPDLAAKLLNNMLKLRKSTEMAYFAKHLPFFQSLRRKFWLMHPFRVWRFIKQGTEMLIIEERVIAGIGRQLLALESPQNPALTVSDRRLVKIIAAAANFPRTI